MKRLLSLLLIFALLVFPGAAAEQAQQVVSLRLYGNPSTGYVWTGVSSDEAVAAVVEDGFLSDDETLTGAPGLSLLSIAGKSEGSAEITFTYARPWEFSLPQVSFTVEAVVTDALEVVLLPQLTLPEAPVGYSWRYAQENADAVSISVEDNGAVTLWGQADGEDSVIFGCMPASGANLYWAFICRITVQDGVAAMTGLDFFQNLNLDPTAPELSFSTEDLEGNAVTEAVFAENALTILNFWEPWCGPCVSEMPDLEKLDKEYEDVQVIGIFSTPDSDEEVREILEQTGVTYPIYRYVSAFDFLQTGYVPTTVVVNNAGQIVYGPTSGAMSYASWCSLVESLR